MWAHLTTEDGSSGTGLLRKKTQVSSPLMSPRLFLFSCCFFGSKSLFFSSVFPYLDVVYLVFLSSSPRLYPSISLLFSCPLIQKTLSTRNMSLIFTDPAWNWFKSGMLQTVVATSLLLLLCIRFSPEINFFLFHCPEIRSYFLSISIFSKGPNEDFGSTWVD